MGRRDTAKKPAPSPGAAARTTGGRSPAPARTRTGPGRGAGASWPTHVGRTGKTPVLQPAEARQLLDTIDTSTVRGLRDRALLAVMVCSFARVSAVVGMRVEDYYHAVPGPPQGGGLSRRGRVRVAPVALDAAGQRDGRAPDEPGG